MEEILGNVMVLAEEFNWWLALSVAVAYFIVDAMYAYYTLAVAEYWALHAAQRELLCISCWLLVF